MYVSQKWSLRDRKKGVGNFHFDGKRGVGKRIGSLTKMLRGHINEVKAEGRENIGSKKAGEGCSKGLDS